MSHKFVGRNNFSNGDKDLVLVKTNAVTCCEVMESVYYYLLACSFHKDSILVAMEYILDQHKDEENE